MQLLIKAVVRIILIWAFLNLVSTIPYYISNYQYFAGDEILYISIVSGFYVLLIALLFILWLKTDFIMKLLLGKLGAQSQEIVQISSPDLYKLLLKVMGIYLIVTTIPTMSRLIYSYWYNNTQDITLPNHMFVEWLPLIVQIILGVWLIIGNEGIRKGKDAIRYFLDIRKVED